MIPHKLRLSNFMCYRNEQTLDFAGLHLACLAGENGHGKSALLDAMTWALWGRARARRDDELITLGESEMMVELEFGLGEQRFRVLRQRSKKGRGQSDLHLHVWDPNAGEWRLLDEGNLNDRQQQIVRLLRLDYETFVNSAFLLQGRADSFTTKTAAERKQVLSDILGLSRYDQYEQRAKELAQERKERAIRTEAELKAIDDELAYRPQYEEQLADARQAVSVAAEQLRAADKLHNDARFLVQELRGRQQQLTNLKQTLSRAERDLEGDKTRLADSRRRLESYEAVLARRAEIEEGWRRLEAARKTDAEWNVRLREHTQLHERRAEVQHTVDLARAELQSEQRRLSNHQVELLRRAGELTRHEESLAEAASELARFAELQERRDALAGELRTIGEHMAAVKADLERTKSDGIAVNNKANVLQASDEATCPLCRQPLTPEHRDRTEADLREEHDRLAEHYKAESGRLKQLDERRSALEKEDRNLVHELRGRETQQRKWVAAEAGIEDARRADREQTALAAEVQKLADRLERRDYAHEAHREVQALSGQIAALGYDRAEHQATHAEVVGLQAFDAEYQRHLLPALEHVEDARAQVDTLTAQVERRVVELAADVAQRESLEAEVRELPEREKEMQRAAAAVETIAADERRARQQEGGAMQRLAALEALTDRRQKLRAALDALHAEQSLYNELREAFGKKGIQAMIIESVIPEVETEANRLLNRMSEGRMSVRLETQREKVTGGIAETLDIIIADELGSRPYETFSGGECFRANLALRIAISKLLARRAGAQLQTLVIDEGFGSQDSTGRSLVVEAINSIQHDFERILVITHIDELKDLFPARIDVVKTPTGSRVSIA
jgi:DNA repair protein SbcC/Rad50